MLGYKSDASGDGDNMENLPKLTSAIDAYFETVDPELVDERKEEIITYVKSKQKSATETNVEVEVEGGKKKRKSKKKTKKMKKSKKSKTAKKKKH